MHLQALLFGPMGAVSKSSRFPLIYLKVCAPLLPIPSSFAHELQWRFKSILRLKVDSTYNALEVSFTPEWRAKI